MYKYLKISLFFIGLMNLSSLIQPVIAMENLIQDEIDTGSKIKRYIPCKNTTSSIHGVFHRGNMNCEDYNYCTVNSGARGELSRLQERLRLIQSSLKKYYNK